MQGLPLRLSASFVLLAGVILAGEAAPDIGETLAGAHKAWETGDALESKVRAALAEGGADYVKLLEEQDAAYEKARQAFGEAVKLAPENPHAPAEFGRFLRARREFLQARKSFEAALRGSEEATRKGSREALTPDEQADVHRTLGGLLERAGDTAAALYHYRQAFALDSDNPRNRVSLAIAICASGGPQDAVPLLKPWADEVGQAEQPAPQTQAVGLYTLALAQEETGQFEEALGMYRRAQELAERAGQADVAGVAERAAMAVGRLEDFFDGLKARAERREKENAERQKKKLEPLPDERENLARASSLCDQGCKLKKSALEDASFAQALSEARSGGEGSAGKLDKHPSYDVLVAAMEAFKKAILTAPRLARGYYELAGCELILGRLGSARKLLDEAALNGPNSLPILGLQGEVLLELGQWEEAARAFSHVLELEPESGRAHFGLAQAYAGLQVSAEQARAALDALLEAQKLGLRDKRMLELDEKIVALVQRFERGEQPTPRPLIRGPKAQTRVKQADALDPWRGTLIDK